MSQTGSFQLFSMTARVKVLVNDSHLDVSPVKSDSDFIHEQVDLYTI